jgi:hypothetical protein
MNMFDKNYLRILRQEHPDLNPQRFAWWLLGNEQHLAASILQNAVQTADREILNPPEVKKPVKRGEPPLKGARGVK